MASAFKLALKSIYTGAHLSSILILKAISFAFIVPSIHARRVCSPVKPIESFLRHRKTEENQIATSDLVLNFLLANYPTKIN